MIAMVKIRALMKYEYCRRELKLVAEERQTMIAEFKRIV